MAVPFRGKRQLTLVLEGAYKGSAHGLVALRHIENPALTCTLKTPVITVR
jgi:hypothetical protein